MYVIPRCEKHLRPSLMVIELAKQLPTFYGTCRTVHFSIMPLYKTEVSQVALSLWVFHLTLCIHFCSLPHILDFFILVSDGLHIIMHHKSFSSILLLLLVSHVQIVIYSENGTCVRSLKWDRMTVTGKTVVHLHSDINLSCLCIFTCLS
jgi:hypothetical protein